MKLIADDEFKDYELDSDYIAIGKDNLEHYHHLYSKILKEEFK